MIKKHVSVLLCLIGVITIIYSLIDLQLMKANAYVSNNDPKITITKENGTVVLIDSSYLRSYDPPSLEKNVDLEKMNISVQKNETITVSYQSPCGIPDSIKGIFLDGKIFEVGEGKYQKLNLSGYQREFYENNLPEKNGTDYAKIPAELESGNYTLAFIIDCDDSVNYYMSNATVK